MRVNLSVFTLVVAAAASTFAQGFGGLYTVQGRDPRGDYSGHVEIEWQGSTYRVVREVEYTGWRHAGRPVSTVWQGSGQEVGGELSLVILLDRMGWAAAGAGLTRTAADGVPLSVTATFRPAITPQVDLNGPAPFEARSERWLRVPLPGLRAPLWVNQRVHRPTHAPPSPLLRQILFTLFGPFHQTPWVQPYVARPEFQAASHAMVVDRTDYDLLQRRPDLLRVVQRIVDPLTLEEAAIKGNAYGKLLHEKATAADRDAPGYFDAAFFSGRRVGSGGAVPNGDSAEWTGDYAYSQALRYKVTGDPVALANVERTVQGLVDVVDITGQPDTFARTLRTARPGQPPTGLWHPGQGRFAGIEWLEGGNNDMIKGPMLGGIAALEVLPAGHPLLGEVARAVGELADHSSVVQDGKFNEEMANGVVSAIVGPGPNRDRYARIARNPFLQLYTAAIGAGYYIQGVSDWSGSMLELANVIVRTRLADLHGFRVAGLVNRLGIRRAARRQERVRRAMHSIAAAGLAKLPFPWGPYDASEALWVLREMPYPRVVLPSHQALRTDFCLSPYPALPWKFDWTTDHGRAQGVWAPPLFEINPSDFWWKNNPFPGVDPTGGGVDWPSVDYLLAYWLGRAYGVIGVND